MLSRKRICVLSFFVPLLSMIIVCICLGIVPFGTGSLMVSDGSGQYAPFLIELADKIKSGGSLFYTWHAGLGINFWALISYYLASPLNLLILWADASSMQMAASWLVVLKIALCGLTAGVYFSHKTENPAVVLSASCGYALSSYIVIYSFNLMWMDVIFIMPIVILGLEKLTETDDGRLYTISLFYALWCNYYIAYMLCLFIVLWFLANGRFSDARSFFRKAVSFVWHSVIAAGMAAVILVPGFLAVKETASYGGSEITELFAGSVSGFAASWLGAGNAVIVSDGNDRNIYSGVFSVMALFLYACNHGIPKKERIRNMLLIAFLAAGFFSSHLNYMWHGFHIPLGMTNRFSFLFVFTVLCLYVELMNHLKDITERQVIACFCICLLICAAAGTENLSVWVGAALCLFMVYTQLLLKIVSGAGIRKSSLLPKLMAAEVICVAVLQFCCIEKIDTSSLIDYASVIAEDDGGFYRSEISDSSDQTAAYNQGMVYGLNSASCFTSTLDADIADIMNAFGLYANNVKSIYSGSTRLSDLLFDVRYCYSDEEMTVQNDYTGSVGYLMDADVRGLALSDENPFVNWNAFLSAAYHVDDVFDILDEAFFESEVSVAEGSEYPAYMVTLDVPDGSEDLYLYCSFPEDSIEEIQVTIDGKSVDCPDWNGFILEIGRVEPES